MRTWGGMDFSIDAWELEEEAQERISVTRQILWASLSIPCLYTVVIPKPIIHPRMSLAPLLVSTTIPPYRCCLILTVRYIFDQLLPPLLITLPCFLQFHLSLTHLSRSWGSSLDFILIKIFMWAPWLSPLCSMESYIIIFLPAYSWIHYGRRLETS